VKSILVLNLVLFIKLNSRLQPQILPSTKALIRKPCLLTSRNIQQQHKIHRQTADRKLRPYEVVKLGLKRRQQIRNTVGSNEKFRRQLYKFHNLNSYWESCVYPSAYLISKTTNFSTGGQH